MRTSDAAMTAACGARMSHRWFRALFAWNLWSSLAALRVPPFLTPDGKDTKMEDRKFYIPVNGKPVEVSETVYREYYRPVWRVRKQARENGECVCPKDILWKCDGDCVGCAWRTESKTVSLSAPIKDEGDDLLLEDTIAADTPAPDERTITDELHEAFQEELKRLDPDLRHIFVLYLSGLSDSQIGEKTGKPRTTITSQRNKAFGLVREALKDLL